MPSNVIQFLNQMVSLDPRESKLIESSFKSFKLNKGDFFLEEGKINRYVGFLEKGLVRYFVFKDGEESTFEFTKEGDFIADYESFNNHIPSIQNIQAIEDCEMQIVDYPSVQHIFSSTKNGNLLGRLIIEHRFDVMVNQLLAIYMQSHEDRYKKFMSEYSDLSQRIPQYMIASYVGVKPPSLSRIRRRFAKGIS